MDMADDALAGGDSRDKPVLDRVSPLGAWDRWIGLEAEPLVAELRVRARVHWGSIVRVDHVAGRAAAGAIVAGVVVGTQKVQCRVEQSGLRQADEHGIGAVLRPKSSSAQPGAGLAGILERIGQADLLRITPATLEDPQDVGRL